MNTENKAWENEARNAMISTQMVASDDPGTTIRDVLRECERFEDEYPISGDQLARYVAAS